MEENNVIIKNVDEANEIVLTRKILIKKKLKALIKV